MAHGYGQFCPVALAGELLGQRWTVLILRDLLLCGSRRFNDLRRGVPRMSPTLLSTRLRSMDADGLVIRRGNPETGAVEYLPTAAALELAPLIEFLGMWGQRWLRHRRLDDPADVGLLMWAVRCATRPEDFPPGRSVVHFRFHAPRG